MCIDEAFPQAGRERMIVPPPIALMGTEIDNPEPALMARMDADHVFMMGDNPALPRMPARPRLLDFFRMRCMDQTFRHLMMSAKRAMDAGCDDKTVLACLLHDISNGVLIRADHGYWGAQMIAPYVDEQVAFAVQYHQPLRYFADEAAGYTYPESYGRFFGPDFVPPAYIKRDADYARNHRFYGIARQVTINDIYFFDRYEPIDPEMFADVIGRCFREPEEGLGMDSSPAAHMWRSVIWPNNFL